MMLPEINNRIYPALETISTGIYATAQVIRSWFWRDEPDLVTVSFCVEDDVSLDLSEITGDYDNEAMEEVSFPDAPLDFRAGVAGEGLSRLASAEGTCCDLPDGDVEGSVGFCGAQVSDKESHDDVVTIQLFPAGQ